MPASPAGINPPGLEGGFAGRMRLFAGDPRAPRTRARDHNVGPAGNAGVCDASGRTVEKLSKSVLTVCGGGAYKPHIETAPPLSGASSALH
jgi:hypothetical protein